MEAVMNLDSYRIQDRVYRLVQQNPELLDRLREIVSVELAEHNAYWQGWRCQEVHTSPSIVNHLIFSGIVDEVSHSRSSTEYRLSSLPDVREAIANLDAPVAPRVAVDTTALFRLVIGHEQVKLLLRHAIEAAKPVHCLLISPPGMAKTLMLGDVGSQPGAEFYVGSTTSKAGLVGMLLSSRPRYLVIDEIDKMATVDMSPLLNLMETGTVTRLIHGSNERVTMDTKVFAGCNDTAKIDPAILSRFAKFTIPPYTPEQFIEISIAVLTEREEQGPEMARLIARSLLPVSTDIRDAVRVARMAHNDPTRVREIVSCLFGNFTRAPAPPTPMPRLGR